MLSCKRVYLYCLGYKVIKKIGEGTFSEVLKTQSLKDGKFYACKTMKQTINRYVHFQVIVDWFGGSGQRDWLLFTYCAVSRLLKHETAA